MFLRMTVPPFGSSMRDTVGGRLDVRLGEAERELENGSQLRIDDNRFAGIRRNHDRRRRESALNDDATRFVQPEACQTARKVTRIFEKLSVRGL